MERTSRLDPRRARVGQLHSAPRMARTVRVARMMGVALLAASLVAPQPVAAHDVVIAADPAPESVITEFPQRIELEFSGIPQPQFNTVAVSNSDTGEILFREPNPTLDAQFVRVDVPPGLDPQPGHYVIGFQITSSDGHATRGRTTFTLAQPGGALPESPSSTASSVAPNSHTSTDTAGDANGEASSTAAEETQASPRGWIIGAASLGAIVLLGIAIVTIRRKKRAP